MAARKVEPVIVENGGMGGLSPVRARSTRFRVRALERTERFGETGADIRLAPNARHAIAALRAGDLVKRDTAWIEPLVMGGATGDTVVDIPFDRRLARRFGKPYAVTHRTDIHRDRLDACRARPLLYPCPRARHRPCEGGLQRAGMPAPGKRPGGAAFAQHRRRPQPAQRRPRVFFAKFDS